ncbi:MAG: prepilin-type N-terminal cleavage/methylation domain-containing protein [Nitrospina sp.]|nr:prepilin-type N-terminal cleavage/methylation domain-containing protein [Nitrospina sp.]
MRATITDQRGFTLIELLVVVAIVGILAVANYSSHSQYKKRAYDIDAKSNLQSLFLTCKLYWNDNGSTSNCDVSAVSGSSYGFASSAEVTISGQGTESSFSGTAIHNSSTTTFTINSAGTVS